MTKLYKEAATVNGATPYPKGIRFIIFAVLGICCALVLPLLWVGTAIKIAVLVILPEGQRRSGKSGSVVWLRNNIMRVGFFPRVVRNSYTTGVRARFANWSSVWNDLTQSQQNSWVNSKFQSGNNPMGHAVISRGKDAYVSLNFNLETIGGSPLTDAPTPIAVGAPGLASVIADLSATTITTSGLGTSLDSKYIVWATNRVSAGTNSPSRSRYRFIYFNNNIDSNAAALWTAYETKFGALAVGDIFFIKFTQISNTTGQQSIDSIVTKVTVVP